MKRAKHINMTEREYQREFRERFKKLKKAIEEFMPGSAYLPRDAFKNMGKVFSCFDKAHKECKRWWRKA